MKFHKCNLHYCSLFNMSTLNHINMMLYINSTPYLFLLVSTNSATSKPIFHTSVNIVLLLKLNLFFCQLLLTSMSTVFPIYQAFYCISSIKENTKFYINISLTKNNGCFLPYLTFHSILWMSITFTLNDTSSQQCKAYKKMILCL